MPRKIASRKNAKPSRANGIPKIGPANAMKPGHRDLAMILAEASCAAAGWRRTSFADRAPKMRRAADLLDERKEELARLMAIEMGKPLAGGRSEAEKCAWVCRYYADNAERFL